MTTSHSLIDTGGSRSFPAPHALLETAVEHGEVLLIIGRDSGAALARAKADHHRAVLVELGNECLGVHTGESRGKEGSTVLGFNRFRLGEGEPSNLVELVRQPASAAEAIAMARTLFQGAGLEVALCGDFAGRIIDRLVRPYYNAALRRLDEGLATADDMDLTLKLGLGYPEGPISLLERTGLHHHFEVTTALHEALGEQPYASARRARVAWMRQNSKS